MWTHAEPARKVASVVTSAPRLQAKPVVGAPGDRFEREADRLADHAMRGPVEAFGVGSAAAIQRKCASCEDEIQPKALANTTPSLTSGSMAALQGLDGRGVPLGGTERAFFGGRLGHDFGSVRVHADDRANAAASAMGARAFTWGRNVVFGAGEWSPGTDRGKRLLAHELVHVAQQGRAPRRAAEPP